LTSGDTPTVIEVRAVELALAVARGDDRALGERTGWLVDTARQTAFPDLILLALAPAAEACLAQGGADEARALLAEIERAPRARGSPYYARQLAAMVRTALAAGDAALAHRLADGLEPIYPLSRFARCAARAQLAEADGEHADAAELYEQAAERWREFGNVVERAHALVGAGRCLLALGRAGAEVPLTEARRLFASMGYRAALAEAEALLARAQVAPA